MTDETVTGLTMRLIRNEIIEECAKIAQPWAGFYPLDDVTETDLAIINVRTEIAAKIRALA